MLIEADKRGQDLRLLYKNETFSVPPNIHIIGMMNTADRGLAVLDYALRRRFGFFQMPPGFDSAGFTRWQKYADSPTLDNLVAVVVALNRVIADDAALGQGFAIGHSYLSRPTEGTPMMRGCSRLLRMSLSRCSTSTGSTNLRRFKNGQANCGLRTA